MDLNPEEVRQGCCNQVLNRRTERLSASMPTIVEGDVSAILRWRLQMGFRGPGFVTTPAGNVWVVSSIRDLPWHWSDAVEMSPR
jgi:hypothetical protein